MSGSHSFPQLRAIADTGVFVEFGDVIDDAIHQQVLNFDMAVQAAKFDGITELVPSYTSVFVGYDPLKTDFDLVCQQILTQLGVKSGAIKNPTHWQIPVCYEAQFAPDIAQISEQTGLSKDQVIKLHTMGNYKVYMYGFAPGFAYLGGVPTEIQVPRKSSPVKDVPVGSVLIAGPQSLISTLIMPSGWWNIGRTATIPLQSKKDQPFLFSVGDSIEFVQLCEADFLKLVKRRGA